MLCQLTSPGGNKSPAALATPSAQSLVSINNTTLIKGSRDLREMADSRTGEGSTYYEPELKNQEHRDSESKAEGTGTQLKSLSGEV